MSDLFLNHLRMNFTDEIQGSSETNQGRSRVNRVGPPRKLLDVDVKTPTHARTHERTNARTHARTHARTLTSRTKRTLVTPHPNRLRFPGHAVRLSRELSSISTAHGETLCFN